MSACACDDVGNDIRLGIKCNERATSHSTPGTYEISAADMSDSTLPPITFTYDNTLLAGSRNFIVTDIEAYAVSLTPHA